MGRSHRPGSVPQFAPRDRPDWEQKANQSRLEPALERAQRDREYPPPDALLPTPSPADAPSSVRYQDQSRTAYLVRETYDDQRVHVPKQRASVAIYPPARSDRRADMVLLRWSSYALLGVLLGGVGAIVLGLVTASVAALLLVWHHGRVRRWQRTHSAGPRSSRAGSSGQPLPAAASAERARLRTAFWQGVLAAVLGLVFVFALLDRLP